MDLIINSTAALRSSLGVRRFFSGVMQHLDWPSTVSFTRAPPLKFLERPAELSRLGRRDAIFWSPSHRGPVFARHHVVSVHDCINIEFVYRKDWRLPAFRALFNAILNRAEAIVALSRSTRDAVLRNYAIDEAKITVIPAGFDPPESSASTSPQPTGRPYVLMVTNALKHKNTEGACRAFADSRAPGSGVILRVVGSVAPEAEILCAKRGIDLEIHRYVDDPALSSWYRNCLFLFSPTLAEGYNLPVAEAIAAGSNVLCSDIPVHREFFDQQAIFFDPSSVDSMVSALNASLDRNGQWRPSMDLSRSRTYRDMAADYRSLFRRLSGSR